VSVYGRKRERRRFLNGNARVPAHITRRAGTFAVSFRPIARGRRCRGNARSRSWKSDARIPRVYRRVRYVNCVPPKYRRRSQHARRSATYYFGGLARNYFTIFVRITVTIRKDTTNQEEVPVVTAVPRLLFSRLVYYVVTSCISRSNGIIGYRGRGKAKIRRSKRSNENRRDSRDTLVTRSPSACSTRKFDNEIRVGGQGQRDGFGLVDPANEPWGGLIADG